jgi:hypothetical protein
MTRMKKTRGDGMSGTQNRENIQLEWQSMCLYLRLFNILTFNLVFGDKTDHDQRKAE